MRSQKALNRSALIKTARHILIDDISLCSFVKSMTRLSAIGWGVVRRCSSLIHGFKAASVVLSTYARWWVGNGCNIDFWHDQWLGGG